MSNDGNPPPSNPYGGSDQPNQPNQYGQSDPYAQPQKNQGGKGLAIAALVVGIFALLLSITVIGGIILGLIAIILGAIAMSKAKKGTAGGRGLAITGLVLGVLGLLISVGIIVVTALFLNSDTAKNLQDCLSQAGSDSAAQQQCQQDFADKLGGN